MKKQYKFGISGSTLKIIAMVSMLIDHYAAVVLGREINLLVLNSYKSGEITQRYRDLYMVYQVMRNIGRVAFPIFCFLLVEGFLHTKNVKQYTGRLLVFALLSEVPFDLALTGNIISWKYQNVFFTLVISLVVIACMKAFEDRNENYLICLFKQGLVVLAGILLATLLRTDYYGFGVLGVVVLYLFRKDKTKQALAGALSFIWEIPAPLAFIPVMAYNGKRGLKLKYVFYVFYPLHLIFLHFMSSEILLF